MRRSLTGILAAVLVSASIAGCTSDEATPTGTDLLKNDTTGLPQGVAGIRALKYEFVATAPISTQTTMLALYQKKLYRVGSAWPTQVWDLETSSWSQIALPDSTFWRWDGAAVVVGDTIFVAAVSYGVSYDILALNPATGTWRHTGAQLPPSFGYPAFCAYGSSVVLLAGATDSVLSFDVSTGHLRAIASNPFFGGSAAHPLSSGRFGNGLYVFGYQASSAMNVFLRFDLVSHAWQTLTVPSLLEHKTALGSVLGDEFVLLRDTCATYQYSFSDQLWYLDKTTAPLFPQTLNGSFDIGDWSFCPADSCLYGSEHWSKSLWKIAR